MTDKSESAKRRTTVSADPKQQRAMQEWLEKERGSEESPALTMTDAELARSNLGALVQKDKV